MRKEVLFACFIGICVLFFVNLPFVYFSFFGKDHLVFLGRKTINSQDTYTYVSFIEQSKQGRNSFENLYTTEKQTPSLIRPSYFVIGKLAAFFNLSSIAAYHIARIILSILFFCVLYKFLFYFFDSPTKRLIAFIVILTSSGLGFLFQDATFSSDLWIPESITFMSLGEAPHFILSQLLMIGGFILIIEYIKEKNLLLLFLSSFLFLFLSFEHPFNIIVISVVIFFSCIINKQTIFESLIVSFLSSFGLLFQFFMVQSNPILYTWNAQNLLPSPNPSSYIAGFGLLLVFAGIGLENFFRKKTIATTLLLTWVFVSIILLYFPVSFQRRFIEGLHIPIAIFATSGLFTIISFIKNRIWSTTVLYILIGTLSLSSFYSIYVDFTNMGKDSMDGYYYNITDTEYSGLQWIKTNTGFQDVILAKWFYSNVIPGITGRKVYAGHSVQTIDFNNKISKENTFLLNKNDATASNFLIENSISYIFLGNNDGMLQYGFTPETKPYLKKVYNVNGVQIYKVIPLSNPTISIHSLKTNFR